MTLTPEDITGQKKYSATNSANDKASPTLMQQFLSKLMDKPNPPDKELYLGDKPPENDATVRGFIDRKSVLDIAKKLTDRVPDDILVRVCDTVFNDGISLVALEKIAALTLSDDTYQEVVEILDSAKLLNGRPILTEHTEAVVAIARALVQYIYTHHGNVKEGSFRYEKTNKTPFMAWQVKETIQRHLQSSEPILVNPGGFDSKKQVDQFYANFNIADIVLWNHDIWNAAIRGCEDAFKGTKIDADLLGSISPMFWQYDVPFTLGDLGQYQLHNSNYDCVGFALLPTTEDHVKVRVHEDAVTFHEKLKDGKHLVRIDPDVEGVREAFDNAIKFSRYGISVAIIFMPVTPDLPPEIRFMRPMFEGDEISDLLVCTILAAAKFLTLKYVAKDDVQVSKKELKQDRPLFKKVRQGKVQVPPIKIVNLRRPERREQTKEESEHAKKRNYKCWWIVDAHWRKQWFPSLNRHQQVRILSYPKGALDKPFKPPREKVYKAVR